jgi:putative transposase
VKGETLVPDQHEARLCTSPAMPKGRFHDDKITSIVKQMKSGRKITELSRELGVSRATLYVWKAKYDRQKSGTSYRIRELEEENRRLKQLIGELCLELGMPLKALIKGSHGH